MNERTEQAIRDALGDFLGILEHKVRQGSINSEDVRTILRTIEASGGVRATVKDLAGYYNQSEDNVRHVIHRNLLPAPRRMVYYDFGSFRERVPDRWTKRSSEPGD